MKIAVALQSVLVLVALVLFVARAPSSGSPAEAAKVAAHESKANGQKEGEGNGKEDGKPGPSSKEQDPQPAAQGHEQPKHLSPTDAGTALEGDSKAIAKALLAGNIRFVAGQPTTFDLIHQREISAGGQHPAVMVLGCADSRVSPELIFDRGIGELFVVRSAGNVAEPVAVGSLEYAAEHLHAKVLLVLGHEKCGAVQATLSGEKMPSPNLETLVSYIRPGIKGLKDWAEAGELIHLAVEANVRRQSDELLKRSPLLREASSKGTITILRAVYDIESGRVRPLP